jgi:hypothetical protein
MKPVLGTGFKTLSHLLRGGGLSGVGRCNYLGERGEPVLHWNLGASGAITAVATPSQSLVVPNLGTQL